MRLVSRGLLRKFWGQPGRGDSETPLRTWCDVVENARWASHDDVKRAFGAKVDLAYGRHVFDIGGNKYRLVCRIDFVRHGVLTLWVGTHDEYDDLCDRDGEGIKRL